MSGEPSMLAPVPDRAVDGLEGPVGVELPEDRRRRRRRRREGRRRSTRRSPRREWPSRRRPASVAARLPGTERRLRRHAPRFLAGGRRGRRARRPASWTGSCRCRSTPAGRRTCRRTGRRARRPSPKRYCHTSAPVSGLIAWATPDFCGMTISCRPSMVASIGAAEKSWSGPIVSGQPLPSLFAGHPPSQLSFASP